MKKDDFSSIVEEFPDPVVVFDPLGTVSYANRAALAIFGPRAAEITEGKYNIFKEHSIIQAGAQEGIERAIRGENVFFSEIELHLSDGRVRYRDINVFPVHGPDGAVAQIVAVDRDATDRVETKKMLADSLVLCKKMNNSTILSISRIIELRDPYTAGHQARVSELACAIASELEMSEADIDRMRVAGLVHDLGKILLPSEILSKPGALTEYEYAIIKKHPEAGLSVLEGTDFDQVVMDIVSQHHERINGTGYPKALTGDMISKEARVFAVADVVEAMAAHRPYRPSLGIEAALREIESNRAVLYDEDVVDACLRLFREQGFTFSEVSNFYAGA